jgi:N-sulfoglucosamine sulfohydrolase
MRPNIVLITAHDIGRHLGCYGVPQSGTQRIDELAETGVLFTNFYSTAPQCSPARASIATGRYPHSNGVFGICSPVFGFDLNDGEIPLVCYLKKAGYYTGRVGVVHETMKPERFPYDFVGEKGSSEVTIKGACDFMDTAGDAPFFLQIGTREAHRPFRHEPFEREGVYIPPWLADEPSAREDLSGFQGDLHALDSVIGSTLDKLAGSGRAENTLFIFLSDHGIPFPRAKHSLYEPGCQITAVLRWPERGWTGGQKLDSLHSGVDLLPTILEALQIPSPGTIQGTSFAPLLDGDKYKERTAVFTEQSFNAWTDVSRAVRTRRYKLIANFTPGRGFSDSTQEWRPPVRVRFLKNAVRTYHPPIEFYDLEDDPYEETNLASIPDFQELQEEHMRILYNHMRNTEDPLLNGPPVPPIYSWTMSELKKAAI